MMIHYLLVVNNQGTIRVSRYYKHVPADDRKQLETSIIKTCLARNQKQSTIVDFEDYTVVYRKFGNLTFIGGITKDENELAVLELFQHIVETLNKYFGKVNELQILYNLDKVHMILDEMIIGGHIAETSQARILAPLQLMATGK